MTQTPLLVLFLLPVATFAQSTWEVDSSMVSFEIRNAGIPVDGTFQGLIADITFDPAMVSQSHIRASVKTATVGTGIRIRDKHLCKSDFLDADTYPSITLQSTTLQGRKPGQYSGLFTLDLKGRREQVVIPFSFTLTSDSAAEITGRFSLNRLDFDIGGNSPILADSVHVHLWARLKLEP